MKRMELKRITAMALFAAGLVMGAAPGRAEVKEVWVGASGMTCGT